MELIKVESTQIGTATVQSVNARDLHAFLGVRKDFSDWIKAQVARAHLIENEDFLVSPQKGVNPLGGRPSNDYALTLEAGKHIAMMAGTPKGRQVRAYFIECERRAIEAEQPQQLALPMGLAEADRRAIIGSVTRNFRSDLDKVVAKLTEQQRHLWRAMSKPTNAVHLQGVGFVEVGGVYRLAGLEPGQIPALGKLSNNVSRALDAFCKRHKVLVTSASVGTREVSHWPKDAAIAWLAETGHNMIRNHLAMHQRPKIVPLSIVPSADKND